MSEGNSVAAAILAAEASLQEHDIERGAAVTAALEAYEHTSTPA